MGEASSLLADGDGSSVFRAGQPSMAPIPSDQAVPAAIRCIEPLWVVP